MNQISKTYLDDLRATVAMPPVSGTAPEPIGTDDETEILAPDGQEKAIGQRLAQARKAAKLSRTAVAKIIGRRGAQAVTDYDTGTSKVRLSTVRQIAAATGADVAWLWLGREMAARQHAEAAPDASLIGLCNRLLANMDVVDADLADGNEIEPDDARMEEQRRLEAAILKITPATFVGHHLRARAYLRRNGGVFGDGSRVSEYDTDELFLILRDLATSAPPATADEQRLAAIDAEVSIQLEQRAEYEARWWASPSPDDEGYSQANRDELEAIAAELIVPDERLDALTEESIHLRVTSMDGARAKARLLRYWMHMNHAERGVLDTSTLNDDEHLLWSLLNDILAAPAATPSPDAKIIALCEQAAAAGQEFWRLSDESDGLPLAEERAFDKEKVQPAYEKAADAYDRIVQAPVPQTTEGLRAAARVAIFRGADPRLPGPHKVDTDGIGTELAWKLVAHLAGLEVQPMMQAGA